MTRRFILLLSFQLVVVSCLSQIRDTSWTTEVRLRKGDFIKPKDRVLLYDSDTFSIYSSLDLIVTNINQFIDEYELKDDSLLLEVFFTTSKPLEERLQEIQNSKVLKSRLVFRTAELLEGQKCLVYNKVASRFESTVNATRYIEKWWTGIRFTNRASHQILDIRTGAF